jgi:lipocalin
MENVDWDSYLGTWHQVAASASVTQTFERDGRCATAVYTAKSDGTIGIRNSMLLGPSGIPISIQGTLDPETGRVKFETGQRGTYVLAAHVPGDWALVTDACGTTSYVLRREEGNNEIPQEALDLAAASNMATPLPTPCY